MAKPGAGALRHRVAWDMRQGSDDGMGNVEGRFAEQFTCYAGFTALRGGETVMAARLEGRQPIAVLVRASSNTRRIREDWRMRDLGNGQWRGASGEEYWDGPVYAVRSISPVDDNPFWLTILVEGGVAA